MACSLAIIIHSGNSIQSLYTHSVPDGLFTGYALCSGDLRSGARWSHWEVETSCYDTEPSTDSNSDYTNKPRTKINPEDVMKTGGGFVLPTKPKPGLLNIDEVIKKIRPTTEREGVGVERERERGRQRQRERQPDRQTETDRQRQRDRWELCPAHQIQARIYK